VLAFAIFFLVFSVGGREYSETVDEIRPDTPAAAALKPGDRILAVDGNRYPALDTPDRIKSFKRDVTGHRCRGRQVPGCEAATPVDLTVRRDGRVLDLSVRPEYDKGVNEALIGFSYGTRPADLSFAAAADRSTAVMWEVASGTVSVFARLFDPEKRKEVSGVVGVSAVANDVLDVSTERALLLLALVSLSLGLINLFPFLPLDGGHIFWSLVEKARGKRVPFAVMERAGMLGFVLVIMLFFLGLTNDIGRLTGEGFNVR